MLSQLERVIILNTVNLFAATPDDVLAEIADLLVEQEAVAGETIFEKDDAGDSMYIIVRGSVRVQDGALTLNTLGERTVFGEMALLDSGPRVATVSAREETLLLRLDQDAFFELMEERIEIARAIIRVLTGWLRDRVHDLTEAQSST